MTQKTFLTLPEAADYLSVSKSTVYQMTHRKTIPFYKPNGGQGGKVYFRVEDLDNYICSGRIKSESELIQEAEKVTSKVR